MVNLRIIVTLIVPVAVAVAMVVALGACGKKAEVPTKTAEQEKTERDAATKTVRDNPVYGDQFKALDKAKATAAEAEAASKKTEETLKSLDEKK